MKNRPLGFLPAICSPRLASRWSKRIAISSGRRSQRPPVPAAAITTRGAPTLRRLGGLGAKTLARMYGPAYRCDIAAACKELARDYEDRVRGRLALNATFAVGRFPHITASRLCGTCASTSFSAYARGRRSARSFSEITCLWRACQEVVYRTGFVGFEMGESNPTQIFERNDRAYRNRNIRKYVPKACLRGPAGPARGWRCERSDLRFHRL